jgi:predicted component of type VI protein secretion system
MAETSPVVTSGQTVWGRLQRLGPTSFGEEVFFLTKDAVTIGRSPSCDVVVGYRGVSRRHLKILFLPRSGDGDGFAWAEDASTNGTVVKNASGGCFMLKGQRAALVDGDELILTKAGETVVGFMFKRYHGVEEMLRQELPPAARALPTVVPETRRE